MTVIQATVDFHTAEDPKEAAKRRARFAAKTIASFDTHILDDRGATISYDSLESVGVTNLSNLAIRFAHERQRIRVDMVHMVNDIGI